MSDLPAGFYAGELYCYPYGPTKDSFGYIPGPPQIEVRDGGSLSASLLKTPGAAVLALQTVWSASPDALAAAKAEIRKRYPDIQEPSLKIGEFSGTTASLTINGGNGPAFTFGPRSTSETDSYRVVFSETLKSTEKPAALNALQGQVGILKLTYTGNLSLRETLSATISGDLAREMKALAPKKVEKKSGGFFSKKEIPPDPVLPDAAACLAGVDRALTAGTVKIARTESPNVSAELRKKVETQLRTDIAKLLCDKVRQLGEDAIYMSSFAMNQTASESETLQYSITREADLGSCFAGNRGANLITEADGPLSEPPR